MAITLDLDQAQKLPPGQIRSWAYNCLDVTGTREIADVLLPQLHDGTEHVYRFERAQQNPAVNMMARGLRVDVLTRAELVKELERDLKKLIVTTNKIPAIKDKWDRLELVTGFCPQNKGKRHKWERGVKDSPERKCTVCGAARAVVRPFNGNSSHDAKHLLYDIMNLPKVTNKTGNVSTDNDSILRLKAKFPQHEVIFDAILDVRDKVKQLGTLNAKLSDDNRYPSSFNVGAAWTGRFSSSKNPFGEGGNAQNIGEQHRKCFQADPNMDIAYIDLKQAESNVVAHLAGDEEYIEAHRSGDVHTYVTRLVWPDMGWTGDLKKDKVIAKQLPVWDNVEGHDFRFQAKRIQHGSNFGLTPPGISMIAKIPLYAAKQAQKSYFQAFNGIPAWQASVAKMIRNHETLVNPLGRPIKLMGRPWDPHTLKQGYAFLPQSTVADILDLAMIRIWNELDPDEVQLLAQVHDALLVQFPRGKVEFIRKAAELMRIPVPINGRVMIIESEAAVGRNWGHKSESNPHGLVEIEL